ncbi:MAG: SPOR domain-containing protein [Holophagaceae bacterium]|nr:SPOR domain-containing protein [Holophagaceae bacterium]
MGFRDPHAILLNRSSILVVTSVGVALLTLSYVLGVQVGKQSAALHLPASKGGGEDLKALPAPILEQLKSFDGDPENAAAKTDSKKDAKADARPETKPELKPEGKPAPATPAATAPPTSKWTLQLLATPDKAEAARLSAKAKAAGFPAQIVKDNGTYKVRWNHAGAKPEVDAAAVKMKSAGFKPFAVPVE